MIKLKDSNTLNNAHKISYYVATCKCIDRQTDRQTGSQTDRQTITHSILGLLREHNFEDKRLIFLDLRRHLLRGGVVFGTKSNT